MEIPGFRQVAQTGVIYVTEQASRLGYTPGHPDWSNLGQGSPEVGPIADGAPRLDGIDHVASALHHYAPVAGVRALRQKVADFYNYNYRSRSVSKYTYRNVCIAGGGRQALGRLVAGFKDINMGHFLPDYTAYEELLNAFSRFNPIPILLEKEKDYLISLDLLRKEIVGRGLRALLVSNPCNPTGQLIVPDQCAQWVSLARELECSLIMDEFYSHYIYDAAHTSAGIAMHSSARYVEDVEQDPVIIVDGVTKNWRYPGWRVSWIVGPSAVIDMVSSTGSFLDGGANHLMQHEVLSLLEPTHYQKEQQAIHALFSQKRAFMLERLASMGIIVRCPPAGGFYVWADLSKLPPPLNQSRAFFHAALEERVIVVPGYFFDVNPGGRRTKNRRYTDHCRISFGPKMSVLERGLAGLARVIAKAGKKSAAHS